MLSYSVLYPQTKGGFCLVDQPALPCSQEWHQILEQNAEVDTIFFDLKKAFDSVPHRPLLNKLVSMGLDSHILQWLGNYLYNRQQRVTVNGEASDYLPILPGVPQGSILGPLLFIIYVNSVFQADLSPDSMFCCGIWHL